MRSKAIVFLLCVVLVSAVFANAAAPNDKALTNQDVILMVKNLLPESVILGAIKSNETNFDVSATGLIALKKAGISSKVMQAMLDAVNSKNNTVTPVPVASTPAASAANAMSLAGSAGVPGAGLSGAGGPATVGGGLQPSVSLVQGSSSLNLVAEATQIAQTKTKPTSLSALAADQALNESLRLAQESAQQALLKNGAATIGKLALGPGGMVLSGIMARRKQMSMVTYVWALQGLGSPPQATGNVPNFNVNYAGLPGVNALAFEPVIVKLASTQSSFRLVGATEASAAAQQNTQQDWPVYSTFVEDRVAATVQKFGPGRAQLTPTAALSPGQYAIALRPVDKSHKFSGEEVAKNQGEGLLFNYAWSFSVK
jgi:hypothetical protein